MTPMAPTAALLLFLAAPPAQAEPTRVACLGDSITHGALVAAREKNAWPAQLGYLLGPGFEVRNFGVGGATLLRDADRPLAAQPEYAEALAWEPEIALCVLGTNDTVSNESRRNWRHAENLERDARALVADLRRAAPACRVLLGSPPPMFPEGQDDARAADLRERAPRLERITQALRRVAETTDGVELVDLSQALKPSHVVDGVHTTPFGAAAIARRFFLALQPEGFVDSPATRPCPSAEYRGVPAGWRGGTWWDQLELLQRLGREHPDAPLVFLGDSITQGLTGAADRVAHAGGPRPIDRAFGDLGALSLGLSGDRTEHVLWRIENGALATLDPRLVVLQIGINNINAAGHSGEETAAGLAACVRSLLEHEPGATILVAGPFPAGPDRADPRRRAIERVHETARALADGERVLYVDPRPLFLDAEGRPNERMAADHLHVNAKGHEAWLEHISPIVRTVLER